MEIKYATLFLCINHQADLLKNFQTFADNLEFKLDTFAKNNPFLIVLLGDLNAKLSNWYENVAHPMKVLKLMGLHRNLECNS